MLDTSVIQLTSQADGDLGDAAADGNMLASSGTAAGQGDVSLSDGDSQLGSAETDAPGVGKFTPITLADGAYNFTATATDWSGSTSAASVPLALAAGVAEQSPAPVIVAAGGTAEIDGVSAQTVTFTGSTGLAAGVAEQSPAPVTVAAGGTAEIDGVSAQSVTFTGSTGVLVLNDASAFTGRVSGLTGSDAVDLADVNYGSTTTATFSGNASGGILTVSNGIQTANIALVGDYLRSGWTLSSDGHGGTVVVDPPLPGTVYANATNTGIAPGTHLVQATSYSINTPGVYKGLIFNGTVSINCSNVTLEDCLIKDTNSDWTGIYVGANNLTNIVIQNCEIAGAGVNSTVTGTYGICVGGDSQVSIYNNNIHDVGSPFAIGAGQVVIEANYAHNFSSGPGTHYNGMQTNGSSADFSLLMEDNSIINSLNQTDAIMINNATGTNSNITITNNLLVGGAFTVYVDGSKGSYPITNVNISNNDLGAGIYGYWDLNQGSLSNANYQVTTSGNVNDGATLAGALPVSPIVSLASAPAGNYSAGNTLTLTLYMSEAVTVSGTPTLTLNDAGTATYTGGAGTNALTFRYMVASGQNASALAVTAVNGTIADLDGHALSSSNLPAIFTGVSIGTSSGPTISSITESPSSGDLNAGKTVTLTLAMSENVTVNTTGGTPTLALNDGTTASYVSSSGNALTFSYTVAAGQNTAALAATAVNLNGATIADGAGNAANLSLTGLTQTGPQIDTTVPTVSSITESPSNGDVTTGNSVTLTLNMSENVTVNTSGGKPTLTLNDGETATYVSGSGTNALTFNYTVAGGDNTPALAATAVNLNGATIADGSGNAANLSLTGLTQTGPQINTTVGAWSNLSFPTQTTAFTASFDATPSQLGSDIVIGLSPTTAAAYTDLAAIVRFNSSDTIDVRNGSAYGANVSVPYSAGTSYHFVMVVNPTTDTYSVYVTPQGGSQIALATNYAFRTEQATDTSLSDVGEYSTAGSAPVLNFSITPAPVTTVPVISSIVDTPSSGDFGAGKTITLTLNMSENVTVNTTGGSPTLSLNDLGTATYVSGSGTNALTFSYKVAAGQNTPDLMVTAVNLNGATLQDGAGNAANLSLSGLTQGSPQIDTTAPTVTSVATSGSGISSGAGDLGAGQVVTLTVNMSENVTVNTTGGTPTLALNDLGTAIYQSGSGSNALTFAYTVAAGQNTSDLAVTAFNLNGATITDGAGNAATMTGAVTNPAGILQIDTTAPAPPIIAHHTVNTNHTVTLTGTAAANSTVSVYDNGSKLLGTTKASSRGAWTYTTPRLPNGPNIFTTTATDAAGNTSGLSNPMDPVIGPNNISSLTVNNGAIVDLSGSSGAAVTFAGSSGTLQLDHPASFSGTISGFAGQDQIDLTSIAFSSKTTLGYLPNAGNLGGTLNVSDGVHHASLALLGQYMASSFVTASDGHGGTLISEAAQSSNQTVSLTLPHTAA